MQFNFRNFNSDGFLDKTGVAVSWACAAHCLLMPFAVSVLPLLGLGFLASEEFEFVFIGLSVLIASLSLLFSFKSHGKINILLLFITGFGFVLFSDSIFEENFIGKLVLVVIGAGFITTAHLLNRRLCLECSDCKNDLRH